MSGLTRAQLEVLRRAAGRPDGHVCPTPGLAGAAQTRCLKKLYERGLITKTDPVDGSLAPTITRAGRVAIVPVEPSESPEKKQERFDTKLEEILDGMSGGELLAIPGLYEVASEALNNEVLKAIEEEDEARAEEGL